jgi:hypothetical protein
LKRCKRLRSGQFDVYSPLTSVSSAPKIAPILLPPKQEPESESGVKR